MKVFFLTLFISLPLLAQSIVPKGSYKCENGNEESICDQIIRPYTVGDQLGAISIEYVGWCGSQGPYMYPCEGNVCGDANIRVTLKDKDHYYWENVTHKYFCDFKRVSKI